MPQHGIQCELNGSTENAASYAQALRRCLNATRSLLLGIAPSVDLIWISYSSWTLSNDSGTIESIRHILLVDCSHSFPPAVSEEAGPA